MASPSGFVAEILDYQSVAEFRTDVARSVQLFYSNQNSKNLPQKFIGYTQADLEIEKNARIDELEKACTLILLTSLESMLRLDFEDRWRNGKRKVALNASFNELRKKHDGREPLEKGILREWKTHHPEFKNLCDQLGEFLKYRHWLAHGRHWVPKFKKYDFDTIYAVVEQVELRMLSIR